MQTLESLKRKIGNAEDVQSVVGAMKVLAIVSIRQFEKSLASLNDYHRTVELGLQTVMQNRPPGMPEILASSKPATNGMVCAVVFGSEQGLSGQFNERISAFALEQLDQLDIATENRSFLVLGDHVSYRLKALHQPVEKRFPIHGSVKQMKKTIQSLFLYFDEMRQKERCGPIFLFHHKSLSGAHHEPRMTRLFPLDAALFYEMGKKPWPARSLPTFTMDWEPLLRSLIREYLRVTLERSFVESLVSENTSRLLAMQVAESNVADFLDVLTHEFNEQRQSEITAEILDIVAGMEAVEKAEYSSLL